MFDDADFVAVPDLRSLAIAASLGVVEPSAALAGLAGALPAGGAVVARALPRPGGQVAGGREHAHVGADLGEDGLAGAPPHAGYGAQQLNRRSESGQALLDGV